MKYNLKNKKVKQNETAEIRKNKKEQDKKRKGARREKLERGFRLWN